MQKIEAKIVADSISPQGHRITSMLLTYPRFIHPELMTHRMFSRNSSSSRAIPFEKMVKMVEEDPFIPIAWQKKHTGMQGFEYFTKKVNVETTDLGDLKLAWLEARDYAIKQSTWLNKVGVTKQLCNRLLEPFMWHTVLVTATEFDNFFELRCPKYSNPYFLETVYESDYAVDTYDNSKKDLIRGLNLGGFNTKPIEKLSDIQWLEGNKSQAEIHIQALAESMWDAMNESKPKQLQAGEWHIPFGDNITSYGLGDKQVEENILKAKIKIATARCARLSYMTFDEIIDYEKDIKLHNQLLESKHYSPFEHCARAMSDEEYIEFVKGTRATNTNQSWRNNPSNGWCNNFRGWIQYRYLVENE